MTFIDANFTLSGNPMEDLQRYSEIKGISEEEAKKELQEIYGNPEKKQTNIYYNDLGSGMNLDLLSAQATYNIGSQLMNQIPPRQTNIEKLLNDKGYQNLAAIGDLVGNAKVEITYANGVPCLQVFAEDGSCVGHMYMENFEENGENQKNKLIIYGNATTPTTVFQFNNGNKLEKIYDSNGNVTNLPPNMGEKNIASDTIADDGMSRVISYSDGSVTEFYYDPENQTLKTYEKKPIDENGNMEIVDYRYSQGVDRNPIEYNDALSQLNDRPAYSIKSAKAFIDTSNIELDKIEEFKNVANVQIDYDSEGNESCIILLDGEGNRIGHMWLLEQSEYTTDNQVGQLFLYDNPIKYIFTPNGKLMGHIDTQYL